MFTHRSDLEPGKLSRACPVRVLFSCYGQDYTPARHNVQTGKMSAWPTAHHSLAFPLIVTPPVRRLIARFGAIERTCPPMFPQTCPTNHTEPLYSVFSPVCRHSTAGRAKAGCRAFWAEFLLAVFAEHFGPSRKTLQ